MAMTPQHLQRPQFFAWDLHRYAFREPCCFRLSRACVAIVLCALSGCELGVTPTFKTEKLGGVASGEIGTETEINTPDYEFSKADVELLALLTRDVLVSSVEPTQDSAHGNWLGDTVLPEESWEIQFRNHEPIGFVKQVIEYASENSNQLLRITAQGKSKVMRGGRSEYQTFNLKTLETTEGVLQTIDLTLEFGNSKQELKATRIGNDLQMSVDENIRGKPVVKRINWKDEVRGPFSIQQSLRKAPLESGEYRSFQFFDPLVKEVVDVGLLALDSRPIPLLDQQSHPSLEIKQVVKSGDRGQLSSLWISDTGRTLKSYNTLLGIQSFAVDQQMGNAVADQLQFEQEEAPKLPLTREAGFEPTGSSWNLDFELKELFIEDYFATGRFQESATTKSLNVRVRSTDSPAAEPSQEERQQLLRSSNFVVSGDVRIRRLLDLNEVRADSLSDAEKVQKIASRIVDRYEITGWNSSIRNPIRVLNEKRLHPLEATLIWTSACRTLEIPTAISAGISVDERQIELLPTCWIEVFVDGEWKRGFLQANGNVFDERLAIQIGPTNNNDKNPFSNLLKAYNVLRFSRATLVADE